MRTTATMERLRGLARKPACQLGFLVAAAAVFGLVFLFQLDMARPRTVAVNPPVAIAVPPSATLKDSIQGMRVYREFGAASRVDAQRFDPQVYSAEEMHEEGVDAGEGGASNRWVLGKHLWDGVGLTRQRSGGVALDGIWAHPKNDSVLFIEIDNFAAGGEIVGFAGMTDHSVESAFREGFTAPVHFELLLGGQSLLRMTVERAKGWIPINVPLPEGHASQTALRLRIWSDDQRWAHFVFDLWGETAGQPAVTGLSD